MNYQKIIFNENKEKYEKCFLSNFKIESRLIATNEKYLAMLWENKGEIVIANSSNPYSINEDCPRIKDPKNNMLDLEFSPFDNHLLASTNDNNSVLLWKIPEEGINEDITNENQIYKKHKDKKVNFVNFNPSDKDTILSSTYLGEIHIWNLIKNDCLNELKSEYISSISWNPNGSLIGCTNLKNINIFETRTNKIIFNYQINEIYKPTKFVWVDNNFLATTSWNKNNEKMLKLWDIRKVNDDYTNQGEIASIIVDNSSNVSIPYINREQKLLYSIGKDEKYIKIYDYNGNMLNEINEYNSKNKSSYSVLFDRKCLDRKLEIDRFIRYYNTKNELFFISVLDKRTEDSIQNGKNISYNSSINKNEDINGKELREEIEKSKNIDNNYNLNEKNENNKKIIEDLKNKIKEKDEIIKKNKEEKFYYEQKIKSTEEKNAILKNQYIELNNKFNNLIKENDNNKNKIFQYEKEINEYKKEIDNIKLKNKKEKEKGRELYEKTIIEVLSQKYEEMIKQKIDKTPNFPYLNFFLFFMK